MQPNDITRWRRALGLSQREVGEVCGRGRQWALQVESGDLPIPRWFIYLIAWTRLYGTRRIWPDAELPAKLVELRKRWGVNQTDLGSLLSLSKRHIMSAEAGRPDPVGMMYAIAWIDFYGSRLPFPEQTIRCPNCGK